MINALSEEAGEDLIEIMNLVIMQGKSILYGKYIYNNNLYKKGTGLLKIQSNHVSSIIQMIVRIIKKRLRD